MPSNVTYAGGCIKYIKSKNTETLSQQQVQAAIRAIAHGRLKPGLKTNREHVNHVKDIISVKNTANPCPKCGSDMVIRTAKKGAHIGSKFWGCTDYPKCRAIFNISQ